MDWRAVIAYAVFWLVGSVLFGVIFLLWESLQTWVRDYSLRRLARKNTKDNE